MLLERFRGVAEALGSGERWYDCFDISAAGLRRSFLVALATLPAAGIIALAVERERAMVVGAGAADIPWPAFYGVMAVYLLAFPLVAAITTGIAKTRERLPAWVVVRHWALFFFAWGAAGLFALYLVGPLPYAVPNFALFVGMFAMLAVDARLAQKVGGLGWGAAVLVASTITSAGLSLILLGLLLYIGS